MMSYSTIQAMAREAGDEARANRKLPWVFFNEDEITKETLRHLPFLGYYVPEDWERHEEFFMDATDMGDEDGPAMTFRAILEKMKEVQRENGKRNPGWAIFEAGQFQVWIGLYYKEGK